MENMGEMAISPRVGGERDTYGCPLGWLWGGREAGAQDGFDRHRELPVQHGAGTYGVELSRERSARDRVALWRDVLDRQRGAGEKLEADCEDYRWHRGRLSTTVGNRVSVSGSIGGSGSLTG